MSLVAVDRLSVGYGRSSPVMAVRDVSFEMDDGEFVGLVGESGSGKSTLGYALVRLERSPARIMGGSVRIGGREWVAAAPRTLRPFRWTTVSVVLQSGMNALNPVTTVRRQFRDVLLEHRFGSEPEMEQRMHDMLRMVNVPERVLSAYPHELSGGMRQRVGIALAMILHPRLVVMDEPTTALDVVVQWEILSRLKALRREVTYSLFFITHDLGVVAQLADRVLVMYAGEVVEEQRTVDLIQNPLHPYTQALLRIAQSGSDAEEGRRFVAIPGTPPDLRALPPGCPFAPRCSRVEPRCHQEHPNLVAVRTGRVRCWVAQKEGDAVVVDNSAD